MSLRTVRSNSSYCIRASAFVQCVLLASTTGAWGYAQAEPKDDKSQYTLFNPTPRELMRPMSTDRPDTTESPYTVDAGHFQLEMSFADYWSDNGSGGLPTSSGFSAAPMLLKLGLLNQVDLQFGFDPYIRETLGEGLGMSSTTVEGFGDILARLKVNLWGNDGGDTAFALMPFIEFPNPNGDQGTVSVGGGLISVLAVELPHEFHSAFMVEFDFNSNDINSNAIVVPYLDTLVLTATVGRTILGDLAGYIEYAGFIDLDGTGAYQGYFDTGLTYGLSPDIQLDCGVRIGLTEAAVDLGIFSGISVRF